VSVSPIQRLDLALRAKTPSSLPREILTLDASCQSSDLLHHASRMIVRATVRRDFDDPSNYQFKDVESLYLESLQVDCPDYLREALNYLRIYQGLARCIRQISLDASEYWFDSQSLARALPRLLAAVENVTAFDPQRASSAIILGKINAIHGRAVARQYFENVEFNSSVLQHDCGAATYFDDEALRNLDSVIASRRELVRWTQKPDRVSTGGARHLVLMSSDSQYLRTYLPYWLSVSEYLRPLGLAFHIIITAQRSDFGELIEDAERLRRALAIFRGYDSASYGQNMSFSCAEAPEWCPSMRSFAACARYLFAAELLQMCGIGVIVQDIDLCLTENPSAWLGALPPDKVVLVSNRVRNTVDPWRKFIAGTVVLQPSEPVFGVLGRLEDYLLGGLAERNAWYLDQNALTYVHETASDEERRHLLSHREMTPSKRPLRGTGVDVLFQDQQRSTVSSPCGEGK